MIRQYDRVYAFRGPYKGTKGSASERYGDDWKVAVRGRSGVSYHIPAADLIVTHSEWS
jgi:ribosomal protein L24